MALAASSFVSSSSYKPCKQFRTNIKPYLIILVQPEKCEICHSYRFPMVLDLFSSAIDDMRDFVGHDEFQVLFKCR
jgi:hypothetical protein